MIYPDAENYLKHLSVKQNCGILWWDIKKVLCNYNFSNKTFSEERLKELLNENISISSMEELGELGEFNYIYLPVNLNRNLSGLLCEFPKEVEINAGLTDLITDMTYLLPYYTEIETNTLLFQFAYQVIETLTNLKDNGVILIDRNDCVLYENNIARARNIYLRFNNFLSKTSKIELNNHRAIELIINDSNPFFISVTNFFFANKYLGRMLISKHTQTQVNTNRNVPLISGGFRKIIGKNLKLVYAISIAKKAALTDSKILLRADSGTGKELFAEAIHLESFRKKKPFIALNCAAIPEHLLESELFGYESGSFTGASKKGKIGKVEAANGGTLFLDEIGDMSLPLQSKILRLLQNKTIEHVGGIKTLVVDIRIIAATHRNLEDMIERGEFRKDLFFRLNVIPIYIPPLKERVDDLEILVNYLLRKYAIISKKGFKIFSNDTIDILKKYSWTGNIRELENLIDYCITISNNNIINPNDLPPHIEKSILKCKINLNNQNRKIDKQTLESLLNDFGYSTKNKATLAKYLNISLATLYRWIDKYGLG